MNSFKEGIHSFKGYGKVAEALDQRSLQEKAKTRKRVIIICIASVVLVAIVASVAVGIVRSKSSSNADTGSAAGESKTTSKAMKAVCDTTQYQDTCISSLSSYPGASKASAKDLVDIAVVVALSQAQKAFDLVSNLTTKSSDLYQKMALMDCLELMDETVDQLNSSNGELKKFDFKSLTDPAGDVRTWLSAALTNLDTCVDGMANTTSNDAKAQIESIVENLNQLTSNGLAIVKSISDVLGILKIPFPTRRLLTDDFYPVEHGFPEWVSAADRRLLQVNVTQADITVAKDKSGNYQTIQEAVDAAPEKSMKRYIIKVKAGIYEENVQISKKKTMLMIIGDGMDNTIVTGSKNVVDGTPTFSTATVAAVGMGFIARDIQFTNSAGASKHQAVALRVGSDKSLFLRCKITAYQDTLYAYSLRQFYRDCYISGTVDFIFGNAAVVFQNCTIAVRVPNAGQKNTVTAQGRKDPNQNTGISIHNCKITGETDLNAVKSIYPSYLGRPWKMYSRTVIMLSQIDDIINPAGWLEWDADFALKTLYYAEYNNFGAGAAVNNRVKWPGYKVLTDENDAKPFTVGQFIGTSWLKTTEVAFTEGLTA
ncbi:hypothetical protein KI387_009922 [Taxus chinensis]|uniref:Pectinesterase n=1 Tax=Taxus chinensis TaxID=29808 RepID=A0AA38FKX8_TAXCH|nr:hypothetical protein KI387_009922 [Taxus chinensis]